METILVQISDKRWTMPAVHLACALARNTNASVILLQLLPVTHPSHLGTSFASIPPTSQDYADLDEYMATAEDYGIKMTIQPIHCMTALDAVVSAAEQVNADAVFAHIPESRIPFWQKFQRWNLERRLSNAQRHLLVLDTQGESIDHLPSITVKPVYSLTHK